jgi:hypothetical protein
LWTSSAAGRSTMVCTACLLPVDRSMTAAQGPQKQTNLTVVLAAHSGAPGRPRTPDSKQAHRRQGKKIGVTGDARIIRPFSRPRRERDSAQRTQSRVVPDTERPAGTGRFWGDDYRGRYCAVSRWPNRMLVTSRLLKAELS